MQLATPRVPALRQRICTRRRMDFSVRCAYAHGTCALRTHLINMTEKQTELTWPAFAQLRDKWRGKARAPAAACTHS